jgi:hypothetical protein
MSLSQTEQIKQFEIGVIISRSFDNRELLDAHLGPHVVNISHVHTNAPEPGGAFLEKFARDNALPLTIWPTSQHAFVSLNNVLDHSKFIYIITDGKSKIADMAKVECEKKKLKYKVIEYDPTEYWRSKVIKVSEVLAAIPSEEISGNEAIKAIAKII